MHDLFLFLRVLRDMLLARVCMHNDFGISLVVRRETLAITLSMEATSENAKIVQFYSAHCLSRMQMRGCFFQDDRSLDTT